MSVRTPGKARDKSLSSTPVPTTEPRTDGSQIPPAQWEAMSDILNTIYDYRTEDGFDPSKLFHRKVNKRVIPEYYDTIKEPVAMSTIKAKIHQKLYQSFAEYVRDFALIAYNAQVFNVPESGAFQDSLIIKEQVEKELQKLVDQGLITQETATLPDLGEIPTYENVPLEPPATAVDGEAREEEEESDEEADDDDDDDGDEDDDVKRKKRRGRPSLSAFKKDAEEGEDGKRARGRPPKLLTPMEARMQTVLKGIRKPRNKHSQLMIKHFDRLPDKAALPDYYNEIKNPMAYDQLKRKVKRKKYKTLEDFMGDVNLMFNNAKQYNQDDSEIYKDAMALQVEAGKLYDQEKAKPDDAFADDEGKVPLPNGILHNGELYKVGDWVHIQNPNDLTKPIPAQIYRTYKAPDGQNRVNVCWYYRPEQTVHRFDKHFFANEVVKTGRYRDHRIDEVEGKCFIMFYTRYFKGRPRNLAEGTEIYVCQARYNETLHQFNTIKTWASCLPDEVRDKDYEMDLFDHHRKMKKYPTPLAYLLKDEQKETDELPKVQWGADGAPPKVGAVHRRPRNEKDSPPPEPTPPPPPKMPTPPPRQLPPTPQQTQTPTLTQYQQQQRPPPSTGAMQPQNYTPARQQWPSGPTQQSPAPQRPPSAAPVSYGVTTPQPSAPIPPRQILPPQSNYAMPQQHVAPPNPAQYVPRPSTANYRDPPPIEVYTLPDAANLSIPAEVREQYQRDEFGRVLFFTTPPVSADQGDGIARGHSVRYLAERARRAEVGQKKRKEIELRIMNGNNEDHRTKRAHIEPTSPNVGQSEIEKLMRKAVDVLDKQLSASVSGQLDKRDFALLDAAQQAENDKKNAQEENEKMRIAMRATKLGSDFFADDWDSRLVS